MVRRVVVVGAGYARLPAVNRLARQTYADELEVILLNARDRFVETPAASAGHRSAST
jgi:NADH dehydrogenase FAD-containing subunit